METHITIREAVRENDITVFGNQLHIYHKRDIFPEPDSEDLEYFLSSEYHDHMTKIHSRPRDRCYFLFCHAGNLRHRGWQDPRHRQRRK